LAEGPIYLLFYDVVPQSSTARDVENCAVGTSPWHLYDVVPQSSTARDVENCAVGPSPWHLNDVPGENNRSIKAFQLFP
jgi:hypothetical protein